MKDKGFRICFSYILFYFVCFCLGFLRVPQGLKTSTQILCTVLLNEVSLGISRCVSRQSFLRWEIKEDSENLPRMLTLFLFVYTKLVSLLSQVNKGSS